MTAPMFTDDEIKALFASREMTDEDIRAVRDLIAVCARAAAAVAASPAGRALFTHEDVALIRRAQILEEWESLTEHDETAKLHAIADRIAALLPPAVLQ